MLIKAQRPAGGRHRKFSASQTTKGRVALVAVATGAVSTAGVGGAAAATFQADPQEASSQAPSIDIELASNASLMPAGPSEFIPQILPIAEFKPVENLGAQLGKAYNAHIDRMQVDQAQRGASVAKPAEGAFTSGYGMRWGALHAGIDIANAVGTPIYSVMSGTVINSGPASGYGQWIRVQHDDGSMAVYGHMSALYVSAGERVSAGQTIAGMGSEGFSTGSHLHFEIHPAGMGPVDPVGWFANHGVYF